MKALILAAGYGTRLYPVTKYFPKPLIKVGKKAIIDSLVEKLEDIEGLTGIIVVTNGRFYKQFKKWSEGLNTRHKVVIYNDRTQSPEKKLGAIGDMALVFSRQSGKEDFLVIGGDNLFKEPLVDFLDFAGSKPRNVCVGVVDVKKKQRARHYGVVRLDRCGRITDFWEKPVHPKTSLVAMCLYHFPAGKLEVCREYMGSCSTCNDTIGLYINWLVRKYSVYGFIFRDKWLDIGSHSTLRKAKKDHKKGAY
ncbi:MAG: nucleotidyltransferase family protein [Candidatus Omnitrophica bacterium]|nr:nucleotidyltransferase family protein [Candidatus Omnitrophota bacterium]